MGGGTDAAGFGSGFGCDGSGDVGTCAGGFGISATGVAASVAGLAAGSTGFWISAIVFGVSAAFAAGASAATGIGSGWTACASATGLAAAMGGTGTAMTGTGSADSRGTSTPLTAPFPAAVTSETAASSSTPDGREDPADFGTGVSKVRMRPGPRSGTGSRRGAAGAARSDPAVVPPDDGRDFPS